MGPSAEMAVDGRMAPTTTTGLWLFTVRFRKYAVSSMVSVPCVTTTPSTSFEASSTLMRLARASQWLLPMLSLAIWNTCSPFTFATFFSSGTAAIRRSTPTVAEV